MGQVTSSYYQKIDSKIEKTYNYFLENSVIVEF